MTKLELLKSPFLQVDLKLKICKGTPVRKFLSWEAKSCGAQSLILGTSGVHHKLRSRISVAKYCANNLPKNISVVCVDNGKILLRRESNNASFVSRKENISTSMAIVPLKTRETSESRSRWASLRRVLLHGRSTNETLSTKKSFTMTWKLKLPGQQSVAAIYPDQKQIFAALDRDKSRLDLEPEKGAIVPYSSEILEGRYSTRCRLFSYVELLLATNNFKPENLIGKGGSSQVYRGCLRGGKELAVKILKPSEDVLKHFVSEIEIITSLHHKNIINLVGFCFEEDKLLLVYNLLSRGSLEDNLHGAERSENSFGWEERYKVALGVAEALDHLHNSDEPIIHRDVKSSNILLSDNFEPQLSDFGLATWASSCSHHMGTSDVAGTFGYLAPEYFMHGKLNEKLDVYAFGVVLLELLSGRKPIYDGSPKVQESLVMWAKHILKEGKISELQDPRLVKPCNHEQFEIMVLAATLCIRHAPQSRPDISLVLKLLQGDPKVVKWAREEIKTCDSEDYDVISGERVPTNIQSFINLALLDLEDDCVSISSVEQNISVEDYLQGRWSRSSSFN
ncbi:receptor-like cytosolic serine/threonine-protein kinase rbk1 [Phtheirospermum japonicum]|uniref:Receptor-like cytosolic serine/threonine-protein kinase rbk1 n=1 Tax=Phtheirospermum japonicum TaxID=374723 RepID=A0A830C2N3_9LAMI|nr:receptor-like cytosolic serine/threonine-protein kinase rbk1 [Phtheirospermum japonicum]